MKTNIKFSDTESSEKLRDYTEQKVASFSKFLSEQSMESAICDVEYRHDAHHSSGDVCYAEVTLEADGKVYRASKVEPNFEKAIDKVKDDILQELRVEKRKNEHNFLKGAREVKEMIQESE